MADRWSLRWPTAGIVAARARTAWSPGPVIRRLPGWADSASDTIVTVRRRAWGQIWRFRRRVPLLHPAPERFDYGEAIRHLDAAVASLGPHQLRRLGIVDDGRHAQAARLASEARRHALLVRDAMGNAEPQTLGRPDRAAEGPAGPSCGAASSSPPPLTT